MVVSITEAYSEIKNPYDARETDDCEEVLFVIAQYAAFEVGKCMTIIHLENTGKLKPRPS